MFDCSDSRSRCSREILNFCILAMSVVLGKPSLAAVPFRPPTTQFVSRSVAMNVNYFRVE